MKEVTEKILPLETLSDPRLIAVRVRQVAEKMAADGWYFTESQVDDLMENLTLFFERDIKL